jgi:CheY-like chemotaxis protein/glyoxylase-like metal-dependent hydrolase (beta-lactamase superfamily II)
MDVRFWGTRGSIAKPGPGTVRYGGNTSCVEVRGDDGTLIVLDCGTGAHGLGQALLAQGPRCDGHLMITHTHWDHIQGFPFFAPLFVPGNTWDIYAPGKLGHQLEQTLSGQMEYNYFPVTLGQLAATIRFHDLAEGEFAIGGVRVVARYLNHPALTLGYRLESGGTSIVYSVDHEPHVPNPAARTGGEAQHKEDQRHIDFLADADLVIHDSQYTIAEYPQKTGWGHTPAEWAVDYALAARARRLALTHHDPLRDDDAVDRVLELCRRRAKAAGSDIEVFAASEGQVLHFARRGAQAPAADRPPQAATSQAPPTLLIADDDPEIVRLLMQALAPDKYRIVTANDGPTALRLARSERPALILLDWQMPGAEGTEVTRALRNDADPALRDTPVVLITGRSGAEDTAAGFAAGVTDYLTKPFRAAHVRTRVQAWLMRRPE